jgi:hypothetical protein
MMQGVELLATTRSTSESLNGTKTATMEWHCATPSPVMARQAEYVLDTGDKYPDDPDLICQNVATRANGKGGTIVSASFTNAPPSRFHVLSIPSPLSWGWATRVDKVRIPVNEMDYILPPGASSLAQMVKVWTLKEIDHLERRQHRPLKINFRMPAGAGTDLFDAIGDQTDKLHKIRGAYYRFTPPENCVRQLNETNWELCYDWERDTGTPFPTVNSAIGSLGQGVVILPAVDVPSNSGLLRLPYTVLHPMRPADPRVIVGPPPQGADPRDSGLFATVSIYKFQVDDNGWRSLPGVPNLG